MVDRFDARTVRGEEERGAPWGLIAALVLLALLLVVAAARRQPPEPVANPAADQFSALRARDILRDLTGDGTPHPVGSPANAAVRDRVIRHLQSARYRPLVEGGVSCSGGTCAPVQNILARLDGTQPTGTVLVLAHYDSVPAGPGAGDDLTGVAAILEVARLLKTGPAPRNNVLFMIDDGEEAGLLGARWFADNSRFASEVKAVVNLEARGTSGPSLMFETSGPHDWTVPLYAAHAGHPVTSSVYATIYEMLPNDTDLSVFKRRPDPVAGLNFAFIEDPTHYHTPADSFANVSPASLQHHGDNALAAVRGLAAADLVHQPRGRRTFFDVLGAFVVSWPQSLNLPLAAVALILVLVTAVLAVRRGTATGGGVALGFLAFLGTIVLSGVFAFGLSMVTRSPGVWRANPAPLLAVYWLVPLAMAGFLAQALGRRARATGLWAGVWIGWAILGFALTLFPTGGISYLFVVPSLVAAVLTLALFGARGAGGAAGTFAILATLAVAAILWFPLVLPLYAGLGSGALVPVAVLLAILFSGLEPLFVTAPAWLRRALPLVAIAGAVIALGITVTSPVYSQAAPQPQNILLAEDADSGQSRWIVTGPPPLAPAYRQAAPFSSDRQPAFPWWPPNARFPVAQAPPLGAPPPQLEVLADEPADGKRHLRLRVTSPRGAYETTVLIPAAAQLESTKVNGAEVKYRSGRPMPNFGYYQQTLEGFSQGTPGAQGAVPGVEIEVVLGTTEPQEWIVVDSAPGLPPSGDALRKARPATAVQIQRGDQTVVSRKVRI